MNDRATERRESPQRVLSLCDRSGNALIPWAEAGYECLAVDLQHDGERVERVGDGVIRYVEGDVREYTPPDGEYRIGFGWPPCTDLAVSGARWMREKGLSALAEAIAQVAACRDTLDALGCPWMIENPVSTLATYWRSPDYRFDPFEFDGYTDRDEAYTKETWLWTGGGFRMPRADGVPEREADNRIHMMGPSDDRADRRAETPMGFARAMYLAHEREGYARPESLTEQRALTEIVDG